MNKVFLCLVLALMMGLTSCKTMKENFGTAEETPELTAARNDCRAESENSVKDSKEPLFKKHRSKRDAYSTCMRNKGYDRQGQSIEK